MDQLKREIDGFTFELQLLFAWDSFAIFGRLCQALGPAVGQVAKLVGGKEKIGVEKMGVLTAAMMGADVPELMEIGKKLLVGARVVTPEGKQVALTEDVFNLMFRGKLMIVLKVIAFAIQANFTGFFVELLSLVPSGGSAKANPSISTKLSDLAGQPAASSTPAGPPSAS